MKLPKDSREFIALLNEAKVKYLVIGGYAVAWHGHPRFTGDVDFFVERSPENAKALAAVMEQFGMGSLDLSEADFTEPNINIQLGRPPQRIDILTFADGVDFAEAWESKVVADWDGLSVNLISLKHLLENKRTTGRPQDLADIDKLS
jgi:hypothetical protein